MEITFFPDRGSNLVRWTQSPTLYHVAIKAGLYRKAVQVYHIPIPSDIKNCLNDDLFISCDDRIGKMLHNICISAVAMSLR